MSIAEGGGGTSTNIEKNIVEHLGLILMIASTFKELRCARREEGRILLSKVANLFMIGRMVKIGICRCGKVL